MKRDPVTDQRIETLAVRMQADWKTWGLLPLVLCTVLCIAITRGHGPVLTAARNDEIMTRAFQGALAVSAMLFLIAFWLDGHWTNTEKLSTRIWALAGGGRFTPTSTQLAGQAELAFGNILNSVKILTITGCAIGVAAVIGAIGGLGFAHCLQLLLLAASYQVFVLSRHIHYLEILQAAAYGELVPTKRDEDDKSRK